MENENNVVVEDNNENIENGNEKYIKEIQKLKQNSVSKEEYDALVNENKTLLEALVDGKDLPNMNTEPQTDNQTRIKELRNYLYSDPDKSFEPIDYCESVLELRDLIIEEYGEQADPFLPNGHNVDITPYDVERANAVATEMKASLELAKGNDSVFVADLMAKTIDSQPQQIKPKPKRK